MPLGSPRHGIDLALSKKMALSSFENANGAYVYVSSKILYDNIGAVFFCMEDDKSISLQSMAFSKVVMNGDNWYNCRQQFFNLGKKLTIELPDEQTKLFLSDLKI